MKHFIKALLKDLIDQSYTLLGLGTAWVLLEGSARQIVGSMIIATTTFWVVTFGIFRYKKEDKSDD
jgi:hypothetical protein